MGEFESCTDYGGLTVGFQDGMKYAARKGYNYAIQFDADEQHMPQHIAEMKKTDATNADIVIDSRFVQCEKEHSARMFGSRIIAYIVKMTTGKRVSDPTSGCVCLITA